MPPFTPDQDTRSARARRRWAITGLTAFCFAYGFAFTIFGPFFPVIFLIPLAGLGGLIIWSLPESRAPPVAALRTLVFAFIVGLFLWPNYLALALPGLPWITVERLTGLPMAIVFLLCLSRTPSFRAELRERLMSAPIFSRLVMAFFILQYISVFYSISPIYSINKLFVQQIDFVIMFFASVYVFSKNNMIVRYATTIWVLAVVISILGVWESRLSAPPWQNHVPNFLKVENIELVLGGAHRLSGVYRVVGPFTTPLTMGEFMALSLPFIYHLLTQRIRLYFKIWISLTLPLIFYAVYLTHARSGVIGGLIGALLYLAYRAYTKWRVKKTLGWSIVLFGSPILGVVAIAMTFVIGRVRQSVWGGGAEQSSNDARAAQWALGIPKIISRPWGYGIGNRGNALQYYLDSGFNTIDSYYLSILLEYGVIGFLLYYGLILYGVFDGGLKIYRNEIRNDEDTFIAPVIIVMICFFVIKSVFAQEDNHPAVFLIYGMLVALCYRIRQSNTKIPSSSPDLAPATGRVRPRSRRF